MKASGRGIISVDPNPPRLVPGMKDAERGGHDPRRHDAQIAARSLNRWALTWI
jgi:hypothetical protein